MSKGVIQIYGVTFNLSHKGGSNTCCRVVVQDDIDIEPRTERTISSKIVLNNLSNHDVEICD